MSGKSDIIGELSRKTGKKSVFLTTSSLRDKVNHLWGIGRNYMKGNLRSVFRIHRIHVFFGLRDPDPLVRGIDPDPALDPDPDPSITMKN
jgi:hypothetical protein